MRTPVSADDALLATDLHVEATYRLTEALVEAENRMRRRVELLSEIVFETNATGALVFLNEAWSRTSGRDTAECLGQTLCSFVVDEDRGLCEGVLTGRVTLDGGRRPRVRMRRADDQVVWVEVSASAMPGGGLVGALHNITNEKQAQDELAKLSLVASGTDNLVVITDGQGRTEWVNQAFIDRTGYTLDDMIGKKPGDVLQGPDTDRATVAQIATWFAEGRSFKAELLNYTRAQEPYWVSFQITPIRNSQGTIEHFVSIQTDSTELRRTREELERAKERAEAANEAKTQFLATISHEMRTPLNVILGSTDIALEAEAGAHAGIDALQPHLQRINANAEILLRLISDMLDVSKIEAGQFDFERIPVKIRACLNSALAPIAERARAKQLEFRIMCDEALPAQMLADPDRLRQIVTNLAENAVKFTDVGYVRVEAARLERGLASGPALELLVTDTGTGISNDAQGRIFERFEQGDSSTTRRKGGAGLGLNIVRSLVEAMGGTVTVRSAPNLGATFRVLLPLDAVPDTAPRLTPAPEQPTSTVRDADARAAHVLVAEDTDANFAVLEIFLTKAGYRVSRAHNGVEAVRDAHRADLILMDVEMPEIDGLEATRRIRHIERAEQRSPVPILALTAHAVQGYRDRCLSAGCSGYLSKPIRKHALLDAVADALQDARDRSTQAAPMSASDLNPHVIRVDAELIHLVPAFVDHCRNEEARLRAAVAARDWDVAARVGHSLKGAGPSLGFIEVGRRGREIEDAAGHRSLEEVQRALDALVAHLAALTVVAG